MNIEDRAAGAVIGALIGDALGLGPHWYYDLTELRKDYGDWITGYTNPKPGRYHAGMKAGQLSQTGLILVMLLRSVVEKGEYQEVDFTHRLDSELLPLLDGTPMQGPGRIHQPIHPRSLSAPSRAKARLGSRPEGMPIPQKQQSEPSFSPPVTRSIQEKSPKRSQPIAY